MLLDTDDQIWPLTRVSCMTFYAIADLAAVFEYGLTKEIVVQKTRILYLYEKLFCQICLLRLKWLFQSMRKGLELST